MFPQTRDTSYRNVEGALRFQGEIAEAALARAVLMPWRQRAGGETCSRRLLIAEYANLHCFDRGIGAIQRK
jgi:hypothetical protein